jgi:hypothetical protein
MASIDARTRRLEKLYNESEDPYREDPEEKARQNAEFAAKLRRVEEKAAREEAEGLPARRHALNELLEFMRSKRAGRHGG